MGSWSRDEKYFQTVRLTVILIQRDTNGCLHEDGMGLRSTSMGDEMIVDGKTFKVAMLGFEEVA